MKLRECPFCGGKAQQSYSGAKHIIICPNCVKLPADGGYIDSKDAVTAWNTRQDNWISVDDRLPNIDERVIAFMSRRNKIVTAMFGGNVWWGDTSMIAKNSISHWQPLPEPPKGSE